MTRQPKWKLICNLGDKNYLDEESQFLFIDETNVYPPELEIYTPNNNYKSGSLHRFILEKLTYQLDTLTVFENGNEMWFSDSITEISSYLGETPIDFILSLCSDDPVKRAIGYLGLVSYFGIDEFDSYPIKITRKEAEDRYKEFENENSR